MTGTLATINGESLAVPGLRFWGKAKHGRVAIICSDQRGAVEVWHIAGDEAAAVHAALGPGRLIGGVELHSPVQLYDFDPQPSLDDCEIVGGQCWTDGTSMGFDRTFAPLIAAGNSQGVLSALADWHHSHFATSTT